jgi:uncharacterized secreted protein with C-terminal beta-propeller domain
MIVTVCAIVPAAVYLNTPDAHAMVRFASYSELENFLQTRTSCIYANNFRVQNYGTPSPAAFPTTSTLGLQASSPSVSAAPSHSETNNQVAGVDELDTVKTDGEFIYVVTNDTVVIVDAYPVTSARLVSRISLTNQTIDGIFVDGNKLAIISEAPKNFYSGSVYCGQITPITSQMRTLAPSILSTGSGCYCYWPGQVQNTSITVYDITNRSSPVLRTTVTVNGTFVGARQIGDYDYLVATTPARYNQTLPVTVFNRLAIPTAATQIYHSDVSDSAFSYTTVIALNLNADNLTPTVETFMLGTSGTIYVSTTNIFLTQPTWDQQEQTAIHKISINGSSVTYVATGTVPGHVLNQFSMDEYNGYFRVATSDNYYSGSQTSVYVLNESMKIVGSLVGLSPGEVFYAARFMGDRAYLVTFKRLDPLFVVNLQDPTVPSLIGQLNVTGVSDYLQPYDSGHLIGIGKSAQDVTWENAALFLGLKISLFDVTNPNNPTDMSDFAIGDRGTDSPALTDQKALLFDKSLNLLVLPIQVVRQSTSGALPSGYGQSIFQAAFVFRVTLQGGIILRGSISHFPSGSMPGYYDSPFYVTRGLYIGNVLYTISNVMIRMNSLTDLSDLGAVRLV